MTFKMITAFAAATLATSAFAEEVTLGDAEAGAKEFNRCKSCHMIVDDAGETIVRGGRTGPNLYNVVGRTAGSVEDFRYGDAIVAAGEAGLVWTPETLAAYIPDTTGFLRETLGDDSVRSKMANQRVREMGDLLAYLVSVSPDAEMDADAEAATN